jgi:hypothetical protein
MASSLANYVFNGGNDAKDAKMRLRHGPAVEKASAVGSSTTAAREREIDQRATLLDDGGSSHLSDLGRRGVGPVSNAWLADRARCPIF